MVPFLILFVCLCNTGLLFCLLCYDDTIERRTGLRKLTSIRVSLSAVMAGNDKPAYFF